MKQISVEVVKYSEEEVLNIDDDFTHVSAIHTIEKLRESNSISDIIFTPNREQEHYALLYGTYSTSDSRSAADGIPEYIGVYSDVWKALEVKEKIEKLGYSQRIINIDLENGQGGFQNFKYHAPWSGWWDKLEQLHVLILKLERLH